MPAKASTQQEDGESRALLGTEPDYPTPIASDWTIRDFVFHTGETLPELRLHYVTIGDPSGKPVLVLHGSNTHAGSMLTPTFAGELFGVGAPLDTRTHYIIIPDSIGYGLSSKPSDGLRTKFPNYNYADMVDTQYRLITEHLGVRHLRLVIGNSMGGMHTWMWGIRYPVFMDGLVPMASQPAPVAGRNQMMRRLAIEIIRTDPDYMDGDYTNQPRSLKIADAVLRIGMNGGDQSLYNLAPTGIQADDFVRNQLSAEMKMDANDFVYRFNASRDYDPSAELDKIEAPVLAINAADDERNPPVFETVRRAIGRMANSRQHLIPASTATKGHATTSNAAFYKEQLAAFVRSIPSRRSDF